MGRGHGFAHLLWRDAALGPVHLPLPRQLDLENDTRCCAGHRSLRYDFQCAPNDTQLTNDGHPTDPLSPLPHLDGIPECAQAVAGQGRVGQLRSHSYLRLRMGLG